MVTWIRADLVVRVARSFLLKVFLVIKLCILEIEIIAALLDDFLRFTGFFVVRNLSRKLCMRKCAILVH